MVSTLEGVPALVHLIIRIHFSKLNKSRLIPVILIANIAVSFGGERSNVRLSLMVARCHYGSEDTRI